MFRVGFLKISAAYLTAWNLGCDGKYWHTSSVAIVKPIDEMQIAGPAASRADGKASGQVCFGAGGKCCRLFMSDVNPLKLLFFSNQAYNPIQGLPPNPIPPFTSLLTH